MLRKSHVSEKRILPAKNIFWLGTEDKYILCEFFREKNFHQLQKLGN